ncbi:hypothetical protein WA577_001926, partial [Blastocystis sp. JDR]
MERKAYVKTPFDNMLKVFLVPNGNPKKNAYILFDKEKCDGSIIDPGVDGYKLLCAIEECQVNISSIFLTDACKSNMASVAEIVQNFGSVPVYMHELERPLFDANQKGDSHVSDDMEIKYLKDKDAIDVAGHAGVAYHVPGHTPGSLCYHFGYFLFTGDSLMCNQIGATSDAASKEQLKKSIKEKLFVLPKETMVLPGSGSFTSIATEALYNPEVGEKTKP